MIKWYVSKFINVHTSDRVLIRDFYTRIKNSGIPHTRQQRKEIYKIALDQHHKNRALYNFVMR